MPAALQGSLQPIFEQPYGTKPWDFLSTKTPETGTSLLLWEKLFLPGDLGQPLSYLPLPAGFLMPSLHGQYGPKGSGGSSVLFLGRLAAG